MVVAVMVVEMCGQSLWSWLSRLQMLLEMMSTLLQSNFSFDLPFPHTHALKHTHLISCNVMADQEKKREKRETRKAIHKTPIGRGCFFCHSFSVIVELAAVVAVLVGWLLVGLLVASRLVSPGLALRQFVAVVVVVAAIVQCVWLWLGWLLLLGLLSLLLVLLMMMVVVS
jgi:hypothetical protein